MASSLSGTSRRRCPSCSSRLPEPGRQRDQRCPICGETLPWHMTVPGVVLESAAVVGLVVLVVGALLWVRTRGGPGVSEPEQVARIETLGALPTALPTETPSPQPSPSPPPNTPRPPTATPLPETLPYVVESGDTLFGIAQDFGVSADAIMAANTDVLSDPHDLSVGDQLRIPLGRSDAVAAAGQADAAAPSDGPPAADDGAADSATGEDRGSVATTAGVDGDGASPDDTPTSTPTALPTIVVTAAERYTIQRGDTLGRVAAEFDIAVDELVRLNPDQLPDSNAVLSVGDEVVVRSAVIVTATPGPDVLALVEPTTPAGKRDGRQRDLARAEAEQAGPTRYPAPAPLVPGQGQLVTDESPLLRWSSAGVLPDGVFYVVTIRDPSAERDAAPRRLWVTSNATALRLPGDLRPSLGASRRLEWSVTVRRRSGRLLDGGNDAGVLLSPEPRWQAFTWSP